jgi:hypothetical protein
VGAVITITGGSGISGQSRLPQGEWVGRYKDTAAVTYTQDKSVYYFPVRSYPSPPAAQERAGYDNPFAEVEDGRGRWKVDYSLASGDRVFDISSRANGTSTKTVLDRDPNWTWESTQLIQAYDNDSDVKNPSAQRQTALSDYKGNRATDNLYALNTWVDALAFDTQALKDETATGTKVVSDAFKYKYWGAWTTVVGMWVDNDDGSEWGDYDDEDEVGEWGRVGDKPGTYRDLMKVDENGDKIDKHVWERDRLFMTASGHDGYAYWGRKQNFNDGTWNSMRSEFDWIRSSQDYRVDGEANDGGDDLYIEIQGRRALNGNVSETFRNYRYNWESNWHNVYDTRVKLSYQLATQDQDIFQYRPVYQTVIKDVQVVTQKDVTVWAQVPVVQQETRLRTVVTTVDATARQYGEFDGESITGSSVTINSGGSVRLSGRVAAAEALSVNAGGLFELKGQMRDGQQVTARLRSADIDLVSRDSMTLDDSAILEATGPLSTIDLRAGVDLAWGGVTELNATFAPGGSLDIDARAGRSINLSGLITADELEMKAGDSVAKDGSITADAETRVLAKTGNIVLSAGDLGGHIRMTGATFTAQAADTAQAATQRIDLTAKSGAIEQVKSTATSGTASASLASGVLTASEIRALAETGIQLNTVSSKATLRSTAAGNVELTNLGSLLLQDVEAYDGSVTVTATGALSAALVRTLGSSDRNDIMLTTLAVGAGALTVDTLQTDDRGDIVLRSAGQIVQSSSLLSDAARDVANARKPAASPVLLTHTLKADQLDARAGGAVTLSTQVQGLTLETTHAGSVTITQGSRDLVLTSVNVADGSLTVTGSGGVELADVRLASNRDSNDVTVTAAGDIGVRYVSAGIHLLQADDRPVIYDATAGAGTKDISVALAAGVSGSPVVSAPDTANANHLRTIDLATLTVVEGKTYTVEFGLLGSPTQLQRDGNACRCGGLESQGGTGDEAGGGAQRRRRLHRGGGRHKHREGQHHGRRRHA